MRRIEIPQGDTTAHTQIKVGLFSNIKERIATMDKSSIKVLTFSLLFASSIIAILYLCKFISNEICDEKRQNYQDAHNGSALGFNCSEYQNPILNGIK